MKKEKYAPWSLNLVYWNCSNLVFFLVEKSKWSEPPNSSSWRRSDQQNFNGENEKKKIETKK